MPSIHILKPVCPEIDVIDVCQWKQPFCLCSLHRSDKSAALFNRLVANYSGCPEASSQCHTGFVWARVCPCLIRQLAGVVSSLYNGALLVATLRQWYNIDREARGTQMKSTSGDLVDFLLTNCGCRSVKADFLPFSPILNWTNYHIILSV